MNKKKLISIVVPCYNEEEVLPAAHERISKAMQSLDVFDYELIYVDDGSRDKTPQIMRELQSSDQRVRVIRFSRNFGHQIAVTAGLDAAEGDAVVLIDADLQDPPEIIPEMVARWREGYDVAYGQRSRRQGESAFKLLTAKIFYRLFNRLTAIDLPLDTGDFRLMDRKVVDAVRQMPEHDRFLRGMITWIGFRQVAVPYSRAPRSAGESKYPLFKMLRFAMDGILSFSLVPLRLAIGMGLLGFGVAMLGVLYALFVRLFTGVWVSGWASLFIAVLFLGGTQLICLGVIGEYIGRIYFEAKQRPLYLIMDRLGFADQKQQNQPAPAGNFVLPAAEYSQDRAA
jgi:polyisoprenyl-phosphate glycosyltransferase